jgi:hypothetical protein
MMLFLVVLVFIGLSVADSSVNLGPLEWDKFSPKNQKKFHVPASKEHPGSRELR